MRVYTGRPSLGLSRGRMKAAKDMVVLQHNTPGPVVRCQIFPVALPLYWAEGSAWNSVVGSQRSDSETIRGS